MNLRKEFFIPLAWRLAVSAVPFSVGWLLLSRVTGESDLPVLMVAACLLVLPGIIIAPPLALLLGDWAGGLFFPGAKHRGPPPAYSLLRARRAQGRFEEALAEYDRMVREHPQEIRAYLDMLDIVIDDLKDFARAEMIAGSAAAVLKNPHDRATIRRRMRDGL